jgi:hypothetical protein
LRTRLVGLLLPLLIHLARRSEQRLIDFAALRWLAARPRPRRKIRFDEWPLLLARLLLLALLALLLARPALSGLIDEQPRVAVLPGVELDAARAAAGDATAQWLWLAPGFPHIDEGSVVPVAAQPLASLLRELDARLPAEAPLTVVMPRAIDGLDAQRPLLSRTVHWQVVDGFPAPAEVAATQPAPPQLQIRHDDAGRDALRYLRAIGAAWNAGPVAISEDTAAFTGTENSVRVWLSAKPVPADTLRWAAAGGRLLVDARTPLPQAAQRTPLWHDDNGAPVLEQISSTQGRWWRWATTLDAAAMPALLEADFPQRLRALLQPAPAPGRAYAAQMQTASGAPGYPQPARELAPWLIAAIALLFLLERWLASAPRRRSGT